jgi:hypothetical protein
VVKRVTWARFVNECGLQRTRKMLSAEEEESVDAVDEAALYL